MTLKEYNIEFEKRFHQKWTSFSIAFHFKSIVSHILDIKFNEVNLHLNSEFPDYLESKYSKILDRLETNEPLQYVLGETEFRNCTILCEKGVLIPRPETEELVSLVLNKAHQVENPKILDLCTGTGCIAISLFHELEKSDIEGMDAFDNVINLAKENNELNKTRVKFSVADVFSSEDMQPLEQSEYDFWVSNPPYIPQSDKTKMEPNVLKFEPDAALFVPNDDPLKFYKQIAISAQKSLRKNGYLFYEIHEDFSRETIDLLMELNFENVTAHYDLQGKTRMVSAQKV